MRRRLFTILSALSLILCIATCVQWARSQTRREFGVFESGRTGIRIEAPHGGLHLMVTVRRKASFPRHYLSLFHTVQEIMIEDFEYFFSRDWIPEPQFTEHLGFAASMAEGRFHRHATTGLAFNNIDLGPDMSKPADYRYWCLATPYWAMILLLAIPPTVRVFRWRKRLLANSSDRCLCCGYDLRATRGRCPECGTVPAKAEGK